MLWALRPILGILARGYPKQPLQKLPRLTPLYGLMTSRYRRGYAFTPNTEREGLEDLRFY
ncbi:MAG: hypothetical protein QNJ70_31695 [Xenococcaceae cyanobacterium MO_207.B15]|nr:hypothetical protein [Xenococcaceae cyanobacterium MO_207.B15]